MFKSNQTWYALFPVYLESRTKRIFAIACLGKKLVLQSEICEYFEYLISKVSLFHRVKELFKSNQTQYGVSRVYLESRTKRIFAIACLGKKLVLQSEICECFEYLISKIGLFHRVKELFKSNQTRYGVSRVYLKSRTKRIFAIACLGKKLVLQSEICEYFEYLISKIGLFHRVKELFKSNQTGYAVSPVYLESRTKRIFAIACLGKRLVLQSEICGYFEYLISKVSLFHRVKELFKSNQTRYGVSRVYLESRTKRIFAITCLGKKLVLQSEICEYFEYLISKIGPFHWVKELFKSNQTRYGVSRVYLESRTKRIFAIACLGKKLVLQSEICEYFEYLISKIGLFHRVKELFKSNQTGYAVSPVYLESRTKRIFAIACLGKKLVLQSEICEYFEYLISKIGLFHRVKELFKSNQTRYGVSRVYLESRTKKVFAIACLEKKFVFQSEISSYSLIIFSKNRNFIGSRSCSNLTKLGMEYTMGK